MLICDTPGALPVISADGERLRQVLLNLVGNAIKYTQTKSVITVRARQEEESLVVEVSDNGPGIDFEAQKHLFEPYYRVPEGTKLAGGLGLGLPIARNVVELHGGRLWVTSRPGSGSTFAFSLPLRAPDAPMEAGTDESAHH